MEKTKRLRDFIKHPLAALVLSVGIIAPAGYIAAQAIAPSDEAVAQALKTRLKNTKVDRVDCSKTNGLCEITAGSQIFYVDPSGRFLVIGRVYDMETRQDLTAARLLEVNPDMLLGAAPGRAEGPPQGQPARPAGVPAEPRKPSLRCQATPEPSSRKHLADGPAAVDELNGPSGVCVQNLMRINAELRVECDGEILRRGADLRDGLIDILHQTKIRCQRQASI